MLPPTGAKVNDVTLVKVAAAVLVGALRAFPESERCIHTALDVVLRCLEADQLNDTPTFADAAVDAGLAEALFPCREHDSSGRAWNAAFFLANGRLSRDHMIRLTDAGWSKAALEETSVLYDNAPRFLLKSSATGHSTHVLRPLLLAQCIRKCQPCCAMMPGLAVVKVRL